MKGLFSMNCLWHEINRWDDSKLSFILHDWKTKMKRIGEIEKEKKKKELRWFQKRVITFKKDIDMKCRTLENDLEKVKMNLFLSGLELVNEECKQGAIEEGHADKDDAISRSHILSDIKAAVQSLQASLIRLTIDTFKVKSFQVVVQ